MAHAASIISHLDSTTFPTPREMGAPTNLLEKAHFRVVRHKRNARLGIRIAERLVSSPGGDHEHETAEAARHLAAVCDLAASREYAGRGWQS